MKRFLILFLTFTILFSMLCACGNNNDDKEKLINNYISAVKDRDYIAIWNMIPKPIQDYAIQNNIVVDKDDALDYIAFALTDYYWLDSLNLPSRNNISVSITDIAMEDYKSVQQYLGNKGIKMSVDDCCLIYCSIKADNVEENPSFFLIKYRGKWYLTSVVGDDELFEY